MIVLEPQLLSKTGFAAYGEVIEAGEQSARQMNSGTFQRFDDLARIDYSPVKAGEQGDETAKVSIVRSLAPTPLPHEFDLVECHPLCSQAFVPLAEFVFYVVVGPAQERIEASDLKAFVTNGRQGISYYPGTWHMPLIAQHSGQEFLVVDQASRVGNLREHLLPAPVRLNPAR